MITIKLDEESLDSELLKFIEGRIKNILRNDKVIGEMIDHSCKREIGKRVTKELQHHTLHNRIDQHITGLMPSKKIVARAAMEAIVTDVKDKMKELMLTTNDTVLTDLFKNEIEFIKKQNGG